MATFLIIGTSGTDDPTRASLPFIQGTGVIEAGHQLQIVLLGEATHLMKGNMMESVHGVGFPPLKEVMGKLLESGASFHLWGLCGKARGVSEADFEGKNARFVNPKIVAEMSLAADVVYTF